MTEPTGNLNQPHDHIGTADFKLSVLNLIKAKQVCGYCFHFYHAAKLTIDNKLQECEGNSELLQKSLENLKAKAEKEIREIGNRHGTNNDFEKVLLKQGLFESIQPIHDPDFFTYLFLQYISVQSSEFGKSFIDNLVVGKEHDIPIDVRRFLLAIFTLVIVENTLNSSGKSAWEIESSYKWHLDTLQLDIQNAMRTPRQASEFWDVEHKNGLQEYFRLSIKPGKHTELSYRMEYLNQNYILFDGFGVSDGKEYGDIAELYWVLRTGKANKKWRFRFVLSKTEVNFLFKQELQKYFFPTQTTKANALSEILSWGIFEYADGTKVNLDKIRGNDGQPEKEFVKVVKAAFKKDLELIKFLLKAPCKIRYLVNKGLLVRNPSGELIETNP